MVKPTLGKGWLALIGMNLLCSVSEREDTKSYVGLSCHPFGYQNALDCLSRAELLLAWVFLLHSSGLLLTAIKEGL